MQLEVLCSSDQREWAVMMDGRPLISFAGRDARAMAEQRCDELRQLLTDAEPPCARERPGDFP